jgi:ferredoxin-NADP reductase/ferredoxin/truncated hemoglobin YjbI
MKTIKLRGMNYDVRNGETVLEALLRQGAETDYSCRRGSCHTCALRCLEGEVEHTRHISETLVRDGHILPCVAIPKSDLWLDLPELEHRAIDAEIVGRRECSGNVVELDIAPMRELDFRAGDHVHLLREDGLSRPYSFTTLPGEDYFFRIHVKRTPEGMMSRWLCDDAPAGTRLRLRGPNGDCHYAPEMQSRPLLLLATGTGAGAMAALARDALMQGHDAPILLLHGVRHVADLYLHDTLTALAAAHPHFQYMPCVTGEEPPPGGVRSRVTDAAFGHRPDLHDAEVFLCGLPWMVQEARYRAVLCGAVRGRIHTDPFDYAHPPMPRDAEKLANLKPEPEIWAALENGPKLTRILEDFYAQVYVEVRLSPFFIGIPKSRAIEKQYEFLAHVLSGETQYLGLNPYNAHHWMVISDDLFDYREALFESVLHRHQVPAELIQRWMAMHELFRAEIVKPTARGLVSKGVEQPLHTHIVETLDIASVCDGCSEEIPAGAPVRYQYRIGTLHCAACARIPGEHAAPSHA